MVPLFWEIGGLLYFWLLSPEAWLGAYSVEPSRIWGIYWGLGFRVRNSWDNGKENGNYYLSFRVQGFYGF